ncbi:MAG TPA: DUF2304 domain-containing protein [Bryobacteraceae bacterium]|nr:DUF2304 domain-containing protein [Bryobacteraceae bacterium]
MRLLNVMTVFSAGLIVLVLFSVRRAHIRVEYSVSWLAAGFFLLLFSRFPGLLRSIAHFTGMESTALALILLTLCVFLIVFYRFSVIISNLKDANIALAQRLAIVEFQLNQKASETKSHTNPNE